MASALTKDDVKALAPADQEWTVGVEVHQKPGLVMHALKTHCSQSEAIALLAIAS